MGIAGCTDLIPIVQDAFVVAGHGKLQIGVKLLILLLNLFVSVKNETFSELRKKISFFICNFAAKFEESYMDMRLFTHTQPSFVQSFRRFERSSHVQQFCTPTSGIGFPRHQVFSHFRPTA